MWTGTRGRWTTARSHYGGEGIEFLRADAHSLPVLPRFDLIVSFETIEHLDDPQHFLGVCRDLLLPGGVFLVSSPYRHRVGADQKPLNRFHKQEWRTEEFDALLRGYFAEVALYGQALKLEKRPFLPLSRRLAGLFTPFQGRRPSEPGDIYPLPGPHFFGLWRPFPAYLLAVCQCPVAEG